MIFGIQFDIPGPPPTWIWSVVVLGLGGLDPVLSQEKEGTLVLSQPQSVLEVQVHELQKSTRDLGPSIVYHPDGQRWVSARQGLITVHHAGKVLSQTQLREVHQLTWSRGGDLLLAAPSIYDSSAGVEIPLPPALSLTLNQFSRGYEVVDAMFSPDGTRLLVSARYRPPRGLNRPEQSSSGPRVHVLLLEGSSRRLVRNFYQGGSTSMGAVALSDHYAAAADTGVLLWSLANQNPPRRLELGTHSIRRVILSTDSSQLVGGDASGLVGVWRTEDGALLNRWQVSGGDVPALVLHPRVPLVISGDSFGEVKGWDLRSPDGPVFSISQPGPIADITIHPTGDRMLVVTRGGVTVEYHLDLKPEAKGITLPR